MIALMGLGILLVLHNMRETRRPRVHAIDVEFPDQNRGCGGDEELVERKYIEVQLTGNVTEDNKTLKSHQKLLKDIINGADQTHGIHYAFNDTVKYKTFVQTLTELRVEKIHSYPLYKDGIWIPGRVSVWRGDNHL